MVSIQTGLAINTAVAVDRTIAQAFRRVLASLVLQSAPGAPTAGVLAISGQTPLTVTLDGSSMKYVVSAGYAVTTRSGQGAYIVGTPTAVEITGVAVGDGTNPRIDRIYIVQPDPELAESGVARIDYVQGTPSASPALPALPTGALELGRVQIPAGAANTAAAGSVTNPAPTTGLNVLASQVSGLQALLDAKANTSHTHTSAQISDLSTAGNAYRTGGKRWISQPTGSGTPAGLSVGDVVVEY